MPPLVLLYLPRPKPNRTQLTDCTTPRADRPPATGLAPATRVQTCQETCRKTAPPLRSTLAATWEGLSSRTTCRLPLKLKWPPLRLPEERSATLRRHR